MDVLLVEDDELVREALGEDLCCAGLSVVAAPTAEDALRAAGDGAEPPPAVLVTDVDLGPGMDGLTLAEQARRRWPELGVVVMTGDSGNLEQRPEPDSRERRLLKPFMPDRLVAEVHGLLGRPGG